MDDDQLRKLRHDLANPLAAMLAEVQLMLLDADQLGADTQTSLKEIEKLVLRMRSILRGEA